MPDLPSLPINNSPASSRERKVGANVTQNAVVHNSDFYVSRTALGTRVALKAKHKKDHIQLEPAKEFDATAGYYPGQVVRVMPTASYYDAHNNKVSASAGVWQCCALVPNQNYSFAIIDAGLQTQYPYYVRYLINYAPQWPEPAALPTNDHPDGRYWELIGMLPTLYTICDNGASKAVYVGTMPSGSL